MKKTNPVHALTLPANRLWTASFHAVLLGGCVGAGCAQSTAPSPIAASTDRAPTARRTIESLTITQDGSNLDLADTLIRSAVAAGTPDLYTDYGITVKNARNVTLRNATVRGFKIAIYAENCPNLTIERCDVSDNFRQRLRSTPDREDESDWLYGHDNDADQWLRYGAGIYLKNCPGATVRNCFARNGQNGICLVNSNDAVITENDMSFMSGWGLAMWRSSRCRVLGNRFDYCIRGYSHGVYARGQDSTGILVYEQCCDNVFAYNRATHGGDGFFLYAGNETLNKTGEGGCNRNLIYKNDFSHAVANGIEATFSDMNVFVGNKLHHCTHGIWAGYSSASLIEDNDIADCKYGISIEHGRDNRIYWNRIARCGRGVWLWWDDDKDLLASPYAKKQRGDSARETLERNTFDHCPVAIHADTSTDLSVVGNTFEACERVLAAAGRTTLRHFIGNIAYAGVIENNASSPIAGTKNFFAQPARHVGAVELLAPAADKHDAWRAVHHERDESPGQPFPWRRIAEMSLPAAGKGPPPPPQSPLAPLTGIPEGREHVIIDEWGPYDYTRPRVLPARNFGWGFAAFQVLGSGESFTVQGNAPGMEIRPTSGKTPAMIRVESTDPTTSYQPFELAVEIGKSSHRAVGGLFNAVWQVSYYRWDDYNDPRRGERAWKGLRSVEPFDRQQINRIDFVWGTAGPTPDVHDRFALVATTTMYLPTGRWRVRTISDDGVRVYRGTQRIIDNWTWHTPAEDAADIIATQGEPIDLRIEYFEIDGNAQLQFRIEPLADPAPAAPPPP